MRDWRGGVGGKKEIVSGNVGRFWGQNSNKSNGQDQLSSNTTQSEIDSWQYQQ